MSKSSSQNSENEIEVASIQGIRSSSAERERKNSAERIFFNDTINAECYRIEILEPFLDNLTEQ